MWLEFLAKSLIGEEIAQELINILSVQYGMSQNTFLQL